MVRCAAACFAENLVLVYVCFVAGTLVPKPNIHAMQTPWALTTPFTKRGFIVPAADLSWLALAQPVPGRQ
jgi:hypothetical protein